MPILLHQNFLAGFENNLYLIDWLYFLALRPLNCNNMLKLYFCEWPYSIENPHKIFLRSLTLGVVQAAHEFV